MNEAEWMACADPTPLLLFLRDKTTERKLRLFAAACCRRIWHLLEREEKRTVVEIAERHADGFASNDELLTAHLDTEEFLYEEHEYSYPDLVLNSLTYASMILNDDTGAYPPESVAVSSGMAHAGMLWEFTNVEPNEYSARRDLEFDMQCRVLRDITGNPFRPIHFDPAWRTDTAVLLARQMYESREFSAMPILADALQDAGCDNDDILNHCRGDGPHVRGCWVVDLVLGKE